MSVNHAMSIIHTIGKLPFVPDFEKKKSFEIFHSSLHLVENRSSSGVPMKPLIDLLIDLFDFRKQGRSWCERFIKTFQTR